MCSSIIKARIGIIFAMAKWWLFHTSNFILIGDENGQCFPKENLTLHSTTLEALRDYSLYFMV